jgi:hypothetical protein
MAHIHKKIDFTVAFFVVHDGKVWLIHHRQLNKWLPLGGHIELAEDPEQAALRELTMKSRDTPRPLAHQPIPASGGDLAHGIKFTSTRNNWTASVPVPVQATGWSVPWMSV